MTKAAVKEREPALPLEGMKDVTPKPEKKSAVAKAKPTASKAVALHDAAAASAMKVRAESKSIIEIAKECAMNPKVDAGKMAAIIAMAREEQNRIDERVFQLAKFEVQKLIPPITRDSLNSHTNSKWARLEKISAIADPIIRRHGFSLSYGEAECPLKDHYRVTCEVTHTPTGYTKNYFIDVGMDSAGAKGGGTKSLAQGSGSSVTYARRFLKVMIFDINVVGEDFDGARYAIAAPRDRGSDAVENQSQDQGDSVPDNITPAQVAEMKKEIDACGVKLERFLEYFGIGSIEKLPIGKFAEAVQQCRDYAGRKGGNK